VDGLVRQEKYTAALVILQEAIHNHQDEPEQFLAEIDRINKIQSFAGSYTQAQKAYAKKQYDQAISLLKGIINQDENYKDASRLLAQAIDARRTARKWWQSRWLLAGIGIVALVASGWFLFPLLGPILSSLPAQPSRLPNQVIRTPLDTITLETPLPSLTTMPTPIPLAWSRLNSGQFLRRDPITAIVMDPNDAGVMYIGTKNAGIYKSIDGGVSWQPIHNGMGRAVIYTLILDPRDSNILYATTRLGGVFKTIDGGQTWHAVNTGINIKLNEWVSIIVMDAQNSQHLFFTQADAIYETQNGGLSWQLVKDWQGKNCPTSFVGLVLDPSNGSSVFIADWGLNNCQAGVYKSLDGGRTWTMTSFRSGPQEIQWNSFWIEPKNGKTLFISSAGKLWVSIDNGDNWTESYSKSCDALSFDSQDPLINYCTEGNSVRKTMDGGKQWGADISFELGSTESSFIAISPQNRNTLFWGSSGLAISSDGGNTWEKLGSGLAGIKWELKTSPLSSQVLISHDANIFYLSKDGGQNWEMIGKGRGLIFDSSGINLYSLVDNGNLAISTNDGKSWDQLSLPVPNSQAVAVHPFNPNRIYAIIGKPSPVELYYSDTLGKDWLSSTGMHDLGDPRLFFDHDQGNRVYAVGDLLLAYSNDAGLTWIKCGDFPMLWSSTSELRAAVDFNNSNHLLVATRGNGIVTSLDGCKSWQTSNTGLDSLFVNTISIDPNQPETMYAASDGGAYVSYDGGSSWNQINDGLLGATVVYSIVVDKDSNVYASTPYGIFKLEEK
jgi:photosystem II stability/assembly factor-like uncharacterized protein